MVRGCCSVPSPRIGAISSSPAPPIFANSSSSHPAMHISLPHPLSVPKLRQRKRAVGSVLEAASHRAEPRSSHLSACWVGASCVILTRMLAADVYQPEQWHDFFLMVGGAAAALAGLVFVAMSLNLDVVMRDATHRYRAIGTLTNFIGIFALCSLALMGGQNHEAVGAEWLVASIVAGAVYV